VIELRRGLRAPTPNALAPSAEGRQDHNGCGKQHHRGRLRHLLKNAGHNTARLTGYLRAKAHRTRVVAAITDRDDISSRTYHTVISVVRAGIGEKPAVHILRCDRQMAAIDPTHVERCGFREF